MPRLVIVGDLKDTRPLLDLLPDGDYSVSLAPDAVTAGQTLRTGREILLLTTPEGFVAGTSDRPWPTGVPWLAWNRLDTPELTDAAYQRGALVVLPGTLGREALRAALRTAFARALPAAPRGTPTPGEVHYDLGSTIPLGHDDVLRVESGVVAGVVLHEDGTEVLVSLAGPGHVIVGHPEDACCLQLRAHTVVRAVVEAWPAARLQPGFADRLRARVRHQEAWAAVQARPHVNDRVLGLLALLAEPFGRPHADGTLIDVRLTHGQLASAIGATRATITRVLGRLRREHLLTIDRTAGGERLVVRLRERHAHG